MRFHRWHAYREASAAEIPVRIIALDGFDPLFYAAKKAIGPLQLTEEEARTTARRGRGRSTSYLLGPVEGTG